MTPGKWNSVPPTHEGRYLAAYRGAVVIVDVVIIYDDEAQPVEPSVWIKQPMSGLSLSIQATEIAHWWSEPLPYPPLRS